MRKKLLAITIASVLIVGNTMAKEAKKGNDVISVKLIESTQSWDGATLASYPQDTPQVTILKIIVPPKSKLAEHKHRVINAGVILKGELTVVSTDSNQEKILKAGDAVIETMNTYHYGENRTDKPVELIVFYAGAKNIPLSDTK